MGKKRICLDPGHYGEKYNAGVVSGYYESATVWKLTQYEKEYLEQMGIEVLVTRSNINENPDLTARGKMAAGCDLFVSNHTNACGTEAVNRAVAIHFTDRNETLVDDQSREFAAQIAKVIQNKWAWTDIRFIRDYPTMTEMEMERKTITNMEC